MMYSVIWVGSLLKKREIGRAEIVNLSSVFFLGVGFKLICCKVQGSKLQLKNNRGHNTSLPCALK